MNNIVDDVLIFRRQRDKHTQSTESTHLFLGYSLTMLYNHEMYKYIFD